MTAFQHLLWGYELTYPNDWRHQPVQDMDAFAPITDAIPGDYLDTVAGQLLVRGEWNWARQDIAPLWSQHIGMLAGFMGAKEVGLAPWKINKATGLEAEILLPHKNNQRLWTGILMHDFRVLHFMVTHPKETRAQFEPIATEIITSLRFINHVQGVETSPEGLPLPPDYVPADPSELLADIAEPQQWRAYRGTAGVGALQSFYLRELPAHRWEMEEYIPFPAPSGPGFARLQLNRDQQRITLGIMPYDPSGTTTSSSLANIVYRMSAP